MSVNLTQSLSLLTYNGDQIAIAQDHPSNLYMGIGLWSAKDGLSEGLPIDVMQMLLSAATLKKKIEQAHSTKQPKVIILIANSMALREGADPQKLSQLVLLYQRSLAPLLDMLKMKEHSEILLSSDLEVSADYQVALETIEASEVVKQLKSKDPVHYAYIRTQSAITHYMHKCRDVGVKVGWIYSKSSKQLGTPASGLTQWDELKFDRSYQEICPDSKMQYLYAKAGWKQPEHNNSVTVNEVCPYTAYKKDRRYIIQTWEKRDIKIICPIQKRVVAQWKNVAEVCASLVQAQLAELRLLPTGCIDGTPEKAVYNMLNHWVNAPLQKDNTTGEA